MILLKCILLYRADDADGYCSIDDDVPSKPPTRVQTSQVRERSPAPRPNTRERHSSSFYPPNLRQKPLPPPPGKSQNPLPPPRGQEKPDSPGRTPQGHENVVNQFQKTIINPTGERGNIFLLR